MPVHPHIIVGQDKLEAFTPYNTGFVKGLKFSIPGAERTWDKTRKCWIVDKSNDNLQTLKSLITKHYGTKAQMFTKDGDIQVTAETALDVTSKYKILGVQPSASQEEIKAAFRAIARKLHPDTSDADAEFFILAKKAYDTLKDPRKRKKYDLARRLIKGRLEQDTGLKLTPRDLMT